MKLDQRHAAAMQMLLAGVSRKQIATELGVHETTVSLWQRQPEFASALRQQREELKDAVSEIVLSRLQDEAGPSLEKLVELRDGAQSEKVQLSASQDLLNRAGFKPVEKAVVLHGFAISHELVQLIRELRDEDNVIEIPAEHDGTGFTSELPERASA